MSRNSLLALLVILGILSLGASAYLYVQGRDGPATVVAEAAAGENRKPGSDNAQPGVTPGNEPESAAAVQAPAASPTPQTYSITIQDGQEKRTIQTAALTVSEVLQETGTVLGEQDSIMPPPDTPLTADMELQITRAIPLSVQVDGQIYAIFSSARTTAEALAGSGITVGEMDVVSPGSDSPLSAGDTIQIVRVREESIAIDEEVPYQTIYQPNDELDIDTKAVISYGVPGTKRSSTRVRYEDGVEVSREVEGEWMEQEPVNEVIGYGTRINTNVIDTPEGPREYWRVVNMRVTAYTAASSGKPPDHPAYGITASGLPAGTGIVAVDPNVIPFRSEVYVPGYGVGFAGDTGGGVKGRWIDLGYDEEEIQAWNGYVDVYYLTPIPQEINYLIPEVLP